MVTAINGTSLLRLAHASIASTTHLNRFPALRYVLGGGLALAAAAVALRWGYTYYKARSANDPNVSLYSGHFTPEQGKVWDEIAHYVQSSQPKLVTDQLIGKGMGPVPSVQHWQQLSD